MNLQIIKVLVIAIAITILLPVPSQAEIPEPMSIPDVITEQRREELSGRRAELEKQLEQLGEEVDRHDRKCSHVSANNTALVNECRRNMSWLHGEIGEYSARVYDFNKDVKSAVAEARSKNPEPGELSSSKGTKSSDPVDVKEDIPQKKGLKIYDVPVPKSVAYHITKPPEQILYNALAGSSNIEAAKKDLSSYLNKYDPEKKNKNAWFALWVLEETVKALNADFNAEIQAVLSEAILAAGHRAASQQSWPGPTKGPDKIPYGGVLKEKTTRLMIDALQTHPGDLEGGFRYLAKLADDSTYPHREAARNALSNLQLIFKEAIKLQRVK